MLISGRLCRWEAIRDVLGACGIEGAARYLPDNATFSDPLFRRASEVGRTLIIAKNAVGNRALLRYIRLRSLFAVPTVQCQQIGASPEPIGQDARITPSTAELVQRNDVPLILARGLRRDDQSEVEIKLEEPTPPEQMMQDFNMPLVSQVRQNPNKRFRFKQYRRPHSNALVWLTEGRSATAGNEAGFV